jgi:hypothetical protein
MPMRHFPGAPPASSCGRPVACPEGPRRQFEQIEGVQHGLADSAAAVQRVEDGDAIRTADHRLAIDRERPGAELRRGDGNCGVAPAPVVAAPREEPHGIAFPADLQPVTVVFDLVDPIGPARRLGGEGGDAGSNEPVGARGSHGQ